MKTERRLTSRLVSTIGTLTAPNRTQQEGPPIVTEGLVGHWDAGNPYSYPSTGTTWTDLAGNSNGTLTNGPTFTADRGGGIVFDGTNDFVDCGSASNLNSSGLNISLEVVFYYDGSSVAQTIFAHRLNSGNFEQFAMGIAGSATDDYANGVAGTFVHGFVYPSVGGARWRSPRANLSAGIHHVLVTSESSVATLYVNGVSQSTDTRTSSGNFSNTGKTCNIGRSNSGSGHFSGTVFLARVYHKTLSAAEVTQNFNATRGRFGI